MIFEGQQNVKIRNLLINFFQCLFLCDQKSFSLAKREFIAIRLEINILTKSLLAFVSIVALLACGYTQSEIRNMLTC